MRPGFGKPPRPSRTVPLSLDLVLLVQATVNLRLTVFLPVRLLPCTRPPGRFWPYKAAHHWQALRTVDTIAAAQQAYGQVPRVHVALYGSAAHHAESSLRCSRRRLQCRSPGDSAGLSLGEARPAHADP